MATISKEFPIDASPAEVWDALADFGALHQRLVPGFVTACELDGETRTVTFANGTIARELLVTRDGERRRLVYAISGERVQHYSAAAQVLEDGRGGTRFNWTIDVLPNEIAAYISGQMDLGVSAMQKALGKKAA